jgi:parvulin-like peptidyl-prolyl isomerase
VKRFVLLLLVLGAIVAVAAFSVPANAFTVNGTGLAQSTFNSDLQTIANNTGYQCYLNAQLALASEGQAQQFIYSGVGANSQSGGNGTYAMTFVRYWMGQLVNGEVVEQAAADHHLTPDAEDLAAAKAETADTIDGTFEELATLQISPSCNESGTDIVNSLPADFVNRLVQAQASSDLLEASVAGYRLSDQAVLNYYTSHQSQFDTLCVGAIFSTTQATAQSLRNQVAGGASFSQLAKANSIDTTSAANGGALGCFEPGSVDYPTISNDVAGLSAGGLTQPIQESGASYFLQLTSRNPSSFASVATVVRETMLGTGRTKATALLDRATQRDHIAIDPRYGSWTASSATIGVLQPPSPPLSSVVSAAADTPVLPATVQSPTIPATGG